MAESNATVNTATDTSSVNTESVATETTDTTDYKALYESTLKEKNNLKGLNDKYCSELKGYKDKEAEGMTDAERQAEELKKSNETIKDLTSRIARSESEKEFANAGFKPEEYNEIIECMASMDNVDIENCNKLSKAITKIITARVGAEKELFQNSLLKHNTVETTDNNVVIDEFQGFREQNNLNALKSKITL